jgi:hypothetical protein
MDCLSDNGNGIRHHWYTTTKRKQSGAVALVYERHVGSDVRTPSEMMLAVFDAVQRDGARIRITRKY